MTKEELLKYIKESNITSINCLREECKNNNIDDLLIELEKEEYIAISFSDNAIKLSNKE